MWRSSSRKVGAYTSFYRTYNRLLTCAASNPSRLVPHPPDLLKWVRKEGGFVHESIKIAQVPTYGLALVASHEIPQGCDLIPLPPHLPLKFDDSIDESSPSPILTNLACHSW